MADLIRSPKPASEWQTQDLCSYNIVIRHEQDATIFFEVPRLPDPHPQMLEKRVDIKDNRVRQAITLMGDATTPHPNLEAAVEDFTVVLFFVLGYTDPDLVAGSWKQIDFTICGESIHAMTDVGLVGCQSEIVLVLQVDKRHMGFRGNPEAQLIALAIATFQSNNKQRHFCGLPSLDQCLIPGIRMVGTAPTFYKILVTRELADAVESGTYPPHPTIVYFYVPEVPHPHRLSSEGMIPLDNRHVILQCFEAFKKFLNPQVT